MKVEDVKRTLRRSASKEKARILQGFFKTGPGEYGERDIFLGVKVPEVRRVAKEFQELNLTQIGQLLKSPIHEERLLALLLLVLRYPRSSEAEQRKIYDFYLRKTKYINNWDLVDLSAEHIVGAYLLERSRKPLYSLARSASLWERRIAILATFHFIKQNEFGETLTIAKILLSDEEDLIHKAVGWMLREIGKRDQAAEEEFLKKHYQKMPRTMLRYAIERFPERKRQAYLKGRV